MAGSPLMAGTEYGAEQRLLYSSTPGSDRISSFTGSTQHGVPPNWATANFAELTDSNDNTGFNFGRFITISTGATLDRSTTVPGSLDDWYRLTEAKIELATECNDDQSGVQFSYVDRDGVTQTTTVTKSYDAGNFIMTLEADLPAGGVDARSDSVLNFTAINFSACEPETRLVEWEVRAQTADEVPDPIDLIGDKVKVETTIQGLRRDGLPYDFTTVTEDDSDAVVYSSGPLLLKVDPSADAILATGGPQAYVLADGRYLEVSDIDIPFKEVSGVTLTGNSGYNHTLSHTASSVKVSFISNNSFASGKWFQLNLQTSDTTGGMRTVDIIEPCELTNASVLNFRVYFNDEPDAVPASAFDLQFTGTLGLDGSATISPLGQTVEGPVYQLSVPVAGDGTLTVALQPDNEIFFPFSEGFVENVIPSDPVTVDQTPPTVTSASADPAAVVNYNDCDITFNFSETVHIHTRCGQILNPVNVNFNSLGPLWGQRGGETTYTSFYLNPPLVNGVSSGSFEMDLIGSEIRDLAGNPLGTVTPVSVTVLPDAYQSWLLDHGQTTMMGFHEDEDGDGDTNIREFFRGQSPKLKDSGKYEDFRVIDFSRQGHGTLTFSAPDKPDTGFAYSYRPVSGGNYLYTEPDMPYSFIIEEIRPSLDLQNWGSGDVKIEVVEPAVIPAGLPTLPAGWSYRQVRFIQPADSLSKAFMRFNLFEFSP
ncbi:MAG: hypothetical protein ACPG4K_00140 [Haloferula sp.]